MAWGLKDLAKLAEGFKDDEGLFQGGEEGRLFGRLRDRAEGKATSYDPSMEEGNELSVHARDFLKNMDVSKSEDIGEAQRLMNALGFKDYEGKALEEDSMLGERTLSAIRAFQGGYNDEQQGPGPWAYGDEGNSPKSWIQRLFGGDQARRVRNKMFDNVGSPWNPKYQRR